MHVSRAHAQILTAPVELPRHAAGSSGVIGILASIGGLFSINPTAVHDGGMLDVLCTASELAEYGEVLVVGDRLERLAVTITPNFYGTELDEIEWVFDRFAQVASGGRKTATISGVIVSIDAVYVSLTRKSRGWAPAAGTATLERLETTAATRRPERRIAWGAASAPDEHGHANRTGYPVFEEGDESFTGWVITLADEHVRLADAV